MDNISRASSGMPLPAIIRLSGVARWSGTPSDSPCPPLCGNVSCLGFVSVAWVTPFQQPPARISGTVRLFPACPPGSRKDRALSNGSLFLYLTSSAATRRGKRVCFPAPPCPHLSGRRCSPSVRLCVECPPSSPCPAGRRKADRSGFLLPDPLPYRGLAPPGT